MRHIHLDEVDINLPVGWKSSSKAALNKVKALAPGERAKAINKLQSIWSDLKDVLEEVSRGKCWYCESRQIRSDKAVDHFRPKNRISGSDRSEGYWWLAFDHRNYRYSCTFCNSHRVFEESSGGKQDHFPIADDGIRGDPEATPDQLDALERPMLLDPTKPSDVALLTFEVDDGRAVERYTDVAKPLEHRRAEISISLYSLNETELRKARNQKMKHIRTLIKDADTLTQNGKIGPTNPGRWDEYASELLASVRFDAEYSAAARIVVKSLQAESAMARFVFEEGW